LRPDHTTLHASCVALQDKGLLILGPSGSGKSALALQLMALGAVLVADDYTDLVRCDDRVIARCPAALRGLIEARGIGILRADTVAQAPPNQRTQQSQLEKETYGSNPRAHNAGHLS